MRQWKQPILECAGELLIRVKGSRQRAKGQAKQAEQFQPDGVVDA
jgi:hypothetical protein